MNPKKSTSSQNGSAAKSLQSGPTSFRLLGLTQWRKSLRLVPMWVTFGHIVVVPVGSVFFSAPVPRR